MMKKVIVAPLNWGLGHASRCVPIVNHLQDCNFLPILASDGKALEFLQKEFPDLPSFELPSYNIRYGKQLQRSLLFQAPSIYKSVKKEQYVLQQKIDEDSQIVGVISDNRFGCFSKTIPSVYLTHQLNVLSGKMTFLSSKIHQYYIKKFDECWIPDSENSRFSGRLSKSPTIQNKRFIGVLSRLKKKAQLIENDFLILLSGPEPRRSLLEEKLTELFKDSDKNISLIRGVIEGKKTTSQIGHLKVTNFLLTQELEQEIAASNVVVCRSGYSSIMDLAVMEKKAIFIPTKGQSEQEYLAKLHGSFLNENQLQKEDFLEEKSVQLPKATTTLPADLFRLF